MLAAFYISPQLRKLPSLIVEFHVAPRINTRLETKVKIVANAETLSLVTFFFCSHKSLLNIETRLNLHSLSASMFLS